MEKPVLIFGAGLNALAAIDIFQQNDVLVYGLLDDDAETHGKEFLNATVLSSTDDEKILGEVGKQCEVFVAIDDLVEKKHLIGFLKDKKKIIPVNVIHPAANIAGSASLGHGNLIASNVVVGAISSIGGFCVLNTGSVIEHRVKVGDYVQIGAQCNIGNDVSIGNEVFIGPGATVIAGVSIGDKARIGAGSVVVSDIKSGSTVFGNPAKTVDTSSVL